MGLPDPFKKPSPSDAGKKNLRFPQQCKTQEVGQTDSPPPEFSYEQIARLDELNKGMNEIMEKLTKYSVQSHMLLVDLTSLYNPHSIKMLQNTKNACTKCSKTVECLNDQSNI